MKILPQQPFLILLQNVGLWLTFLFALMPLQSQEAPLISVNKTSEGFSIPQAGKTFSFPRDHGNHPDFKIEWWYVTGHLFAEDGRRFGFQATFFRQAASSKPDAGTNPLFQHQQFHLAHMALLDVKTGKFLHQERLNREGWDAASSVETLDVSNGNWSLQMTDVTSQTMKLRGSVLGEADFDLSLSPAKPLVVFGENGVSRKAQLPTAASHYLTFTRLKTSGTLRLGDVLFNVKGEAWMDHEISSSQLSQEQAGWDWASIQLKDGREIMVYRLRKKDGSMDEFSTLAWIDAAANVQHFKPDRYKWAELGHWKSPLTGANYPIRVGIQTTDPVTQTSVSFTLEPLAEAQEQTGVLGGSAYWEGACRVLDDKGNDVGSAFLELSGYTGDLAKHFR